MLKNYSVGIGTNDVSVKFNTDRILRNHVGAISNLEVEVNGKAEAITDGKMLAACKVPGLVGLIDEIKAQITSEEPLTEVQEKN